MNLSKSLLNGTRIINNECIINIVKTPYSNLARKKFATSISTSDII